MKFSILLLLTLILATSCNEDDAPAGDTLVGEWKAKSARSTYDEDNIFFGELYSRTEYLSGDIFFDFEADGTFESSGQAMMFQLTILEGDTTDNGPRSVDFTSSGTYTAEQGKLQLVHLTEGGLPRAWPDSSQVYDYAINGNDLTYNFIQDTFWVSPNTGETHYFDTELLNTLERR